MTRYQYEELQKAAQRYIQARNDARAAAQAQREAIEALHIHAGLTIVNGGLNNDH